MSTHEAEVLRRQLQEHGRVRGKRFHPELRRRIVAYAERRRVEGASWMAIATELGACFETLRRWCGGEGSATTPKLRRVEVVTEPVVATKSARGLAVVTPSGLRIEGVGIDEVVALVRALG